MLQQNLAKIISLGILFLVAIIFGLALPYVVVRALAKRSESPRLSLLFGILNCFSGGIFLSMTFLTLLPEAREAMEELTVNGFPFSELLMCGGFLMILSMESLVSTLHQHGNKDEGRSVAEIHQNQETPRRTQYQTIVVTDPAPAANSTRVHASGDTQQRPEDPEKGPRDPNSLTGIRSIFLLFSMSIHMVFDGVEVGLMADETKVWSVLITVAIHKMLIFFSIGMTVCENSSTSRFIGAMFSLSLVTPVGVGIGIAVTSQDGDDIATVSAVLQGVAAGTFFYVTLFEVLFKEFILHSDKFKIYKSSSAVLGCGLFVFIKYWTE